MNTRLDRLAWFTGGYTLDEILKNRQQNNFTLLRLLAALLVIAIHCIDFSGNKFTGYLGALGVPVFFFLSGMLISESFDNSNTVRSYLWKRMLRVYPAAVVIILLSALVLGPILTIFPLSNYFSDPDFYRYLFSMSLVRIHFYLPGVFLNSTLGTSSVNASLWSLALELKLYLLVLAWGFLKFRYKDGLLLALTITLVYTGLFFGNEIQYRIGQYLENFSFFSYFSNAYMFLAGMVCYAYRKNIFISRYWGFIILPVFVIAVELGFMDYLTHFLLAATLLYAGAFGTNYLAKFTPASDYSYGLYLYAFPVQEILLNYFIPGAGEFQRFFWTVTCTFPFAFLSWHLVEKKALKFKNYVK